MRVLEAVSDDVVIATYLHAEIESSRYGGEILSRLARDDRARSILDDPRLDSADENAYRRSLLTGYRGWGRGHGPFRTFPGDVQWHRAEVTRDELATVRYAYDDGYWNPFSGGTGYPRDAVSRMREGLNDPEDLPWYERLAADLCADKRFDEIIVVASDASAPLVVLEGHCRITAFMVRPECLPERTAVLVGLASSIKRWWGYRWYMSETETRADQAQD